MTRRSGHAFRSSAGSPNCCSLWDTGCGSTHPPHRMWRFPIRETRSGLACCPATHISTTHLQGHFMHVRDRFDMAKKSTTASQRGVGVHAIRLRCHIFCKVRSSETKRSGVIVLSLHLLACGTRLINQLRSDSAHTVLGTCPLEAEFSRPVR